MTRSSAASFDVVIVGAGPAGLNAALVLGRASLRVLVLDAGQPRNATSRAMHGFLSLDGHDPAELRRIARLQFPGRQVAGDILGILKGIFFVIGTRLPRQRLRRIAFGLPARIPATSGLIALHGGARYGGGWPAHGTAAARVVSGRRVLH